MQTAGLLIEQHAAGAGDAGLLGLAVELLGALLRASPDGVDASVDRALARMGQACGIDRSYVFRYIDDDRGTLIDNTHEWCAEGVPSTIQMCRNLPAEMIAPWRDQLFEDDAVEIADIDTLPEDSGQRALLAQQGIRSMLVVPMRAGGRFTGFVGFDSVRARRAFPPGELQLLKSVADAIGAVLARAEDAKQIAATQAGLALAHDRLKTTLGALPDLVLEVDAEGRYLAVHTGDPGQMMVPPEHLIGRTHEEVMPPEIAALNRRAMAEVDARGRAGPHAFWAETPRGRRRYALTVAPRPSHLPGGPPGYVFVARDVSEEWHLTREAERLSLIAQRMTDLVMVIGVDDRIAWVNPAFEARTGWTLAEARGHTPCELLHAPGTDRSEVARIDTEMATGRAVRAELLNRTRSGEEFWTEIDMHPLHDSDGELLGFVSIETDITERKAQAAALERLAREASEARARLETAVEALPDAFAFYDAEDRLVLCNRRHRELYPRTAELMEPGVPFATLIHAAVARGDIAAPGGDVEGLLAARLALRRSPGQSVERQLTSGAWLRVLDFATADGGRVAMGIDITALKEAELRLADIIDGAEVGTWEWDVTSGKTRINPRWAEMLGHDPADLAELTVKHWLPWIHPQDLPASDHGVRRILAGEAEHYDAVFRMRHRAGHWVWLQSRGRVTRRGPGGQALTVAGIHIDITTLKRTEERLEQIIDGASAGTWELDTRTGDLRVNDRWSEMLGYAPEDLADQPDHGFRALVHPDDLVQLLIQHETLVQGTDRFANEIRMRHRDGHWVWFLSRGRVVARDTRGRPLRLAGIHLDITERKRLEGQLTAERDYLSRLMETSASGIVALDGAGRIIFANREAERILGLDAPDSANRVFDDPAWSIAALDGGPFPAEALPFTRVMAEGRTVRDVRFSICWPDGTRRKLSVNAAPIRAEGLAVRVVCSVNDITEQVAAEAALRAAAERAEAANRAKSQFLANMSHEIRTPLFGVLGMAQVLEDDLTEPRHRELLGTIRASGETLLGVLNDVLDMSKIEAGKLTLEALPFVPAELAARIAALHRMQASAKGLDFTLTAAPEADMARMGDAGRLAQVLHNLLGNAVKFTEAGGVTVTLGAAGAGEMLELVVRDTGIGMTAAQLSRVFEDFEQADGTVTRRFGGTGLGMSIVRRLVTLMGGQIAVDSAPGRGTEVRISLPLPLADPTLQEDAAAADPASASAPGPDAGPPAALAGLRILAADDNRTNQAILRAMLATLGARVELFADGRAAVDAWRPGRFDLYLLDISMPVLDGISALACLRGCEDAAGQPPAPAIAITANAMAHQVAEYLQAGFVGHLGKPFRREALAEVLQTAVAAERRPAPC